MRSPLFDAYLRFAGDLADIHGETSVNGPCPFCGSADYSGHHRSDRFVLWLDRSEGIGKTCAEHGIAGIYWCRQCGKTGDTISYLMEAENLEFKQACEECGISTGAKPMELHSRRSAPMEKPKRAAFEGRPVEDPSAIWQAHAARMDEAARKALPECGAAVRWLLEKHGITRRMAERYGLGFLAGENGKDVRFRLRSSFGLPAKIDAEGREQKKMAIRRGITIVSRNAAGDITMFRVRRPNGDIREKQGKFYELPGGSKCSYHLPPAGNPLVRVYVVVEGEMDAMLLHAVSGESVGVVATRACTNRPDEETHAALRRADLILVALDSDAAGQKGTGWWLDTYPKARPYPVPGYKDPGDAFEAGFDLRLWLEAAMPRSLVLAPSTCADIPDATATDPVSPNAGDAVHASESPDASVEQSPASSSFGGRGEAFGSDTSVPYKSLDDGCPFAPVDDPSAALESACTPASASEPLPWDEQPEASPAGIADAHAIPARHADILTPEVLRGLRVAAPAYIDFDLIPADVLALAVLWRGVPVHYVKIDGGFEWRVPAGFRKRAPVMYERFIQLATGSQDVAEWLSCHVAADVWSGNFLAMCGGESWTE